jgi:hypothetical protein
MGATALIEDHKRMKIAKVPAETSINQLPRRQMHISNLIQHYYLNMMKTAILAAMLGSAAAFAPAQQVCFFGGRTEV